MGRLVCATCLEAPAEPGGRHCLDCGTAHHARLTGQVGMVSRRGADGRVVELGAAALAALEGLP
jgi:hypothetical protein